MVQTIAFDFDGVLVDSNSIKRNGYWKIFARFTDTHPEIEPFIIEELEHNRGRDRYAIIKSVLERMGGMEIFPADFTADARYQQDCALYNEYCEKQVMAAPEIPGALRALQKLHHRHALYINSATPIEPLLRTVSARGLESYFQGVFGSEASKEKNLQTIIRESGSAPNTTVFVGDARSDYLAAVETGCRFVGVKNEFNSFETLDIIMVNDLSKLDRIIAALP